MWKLSLLRAAQPRACGAASDPIPRGGLAETRPPGPHSRGKVRQGRGGPDWDGWMQTGKEKRRPPRARKLAQNHSLLAVGLHFLLGIVSRAPTGRPGEAERREAGKRGPRMGRLRRRDGETRRQGGTETREGDAETGGDAQNQEDPACRLDRLGVQRPFPCPFGSPQVFRSASRKSVTGTQPQCQPRLQGNPGKPRAAGAPPRGGEKGGRGGVRGEARLRPALSRAPPPPAPACL
ncbi:uncharacterized protein [Odocoileus virginianus]|uniref:Uncharacterized protein n=1 Tax=Odocoileus virginianus TaxID=9874 RepID=A0ABM4GU22_ODOVR